VETEQVRKHFYSYGENIKVGRNVDFSNPNRISIGSNVELGHDSYICVHRSYNRVVDWNIKIHENVFINRNVIIESFNQVEIEQYVMFGPQVYISDNNHSYQSHNVPIMLQGINPQVNKAWVGAGSWIGAGAKIIGNVSIGVGSVVAANSVIVKDVPSHVVVGGNPAKIIKICDYRTSQWINVKSNSKLLNEILAQRGIFKGYDFVTISAVVQKVMGGHKV